MKISKAKTETMVLSRTPDEMNISLDGQVLKQCRKFKYLGVMFGQENASQMEITH